MKPQRGAKFILAGGLREPDADFERGLELEVDAAMLNFGLVQTFHRAWPALPANVAGMFGPGSGVSVSFLELLVPSLKPWAVTLMTPSGPL